MDVVSDISRCVVQTEGPDITLRHLWRTVTAFIGFLEFSGESEESCRILLSNVGSCLQTIRKYEEAKKMYRQTLELSKNVLGNDLR